MGLGLKQATKASKAAEAKRDKKPKEPKADKPAKKKAVEKDDDVKTQERDLKQLWFIRRLEQEVEQAEDAHDKAARAKKNAKSHFDAKVEQLRAAVRDRDEAYPLFDGKEPEPKAEPAKDQAPPAVADEMIAAVKPTEGVEVDWTSKLIAVLGLGKPLNEKLRKAQIFTMGELRDRANGDLPEECKMTDMELDRFGKACDEFWAANKVGDYAAKP